MNLTISEVEPDVNDVEVETGAETKAAEDMMTKISKGPFLYKLSRPVTVGDETYTEIEVDFTQLSTEDMMRASKYPGCLTGDGLPVEFSKTYQLHIAALATKIPFAALKTFPIADGSALTMWAQLFLIKATSQITSQ